MIARIRLFAKRHAGLFLAAAGVGSAFVVMIGTGYRVTRTPGSPIGDIAYIASIAVLVLVIGGAVGSVWRRGARPARKAIPSTPTFSSTAGPRHYDTSSTDGPSTEQFHQLRSRIVPLVRVIDAPAEMIPTFQRSEGNGLPHIEVHGDTYSYVHAERGQEFERFSTTSVDEMLYRIFRDIAWSMSANRARPHRDPHEDFRREMFRQQLVLLGRLNAEWASRCATEHQAVLAKYPFVDDG